MAVKFAGFRICLAKDSAQSVILLWLAYRINVVQQSCHQHNFDFDVYL